MEEAEEMKLELIGILSAKSGPFALVIDLRGLVPFEPEVSEVIVEAHAACMRMSCERTAIIVESPVLRGQVTRICFSAFPGKSDRLICASKVPDWEERAVAWAANGIEPDSEVAGNAAVTRT